MDQQRNADLSTDQAPLQATPPTDQHNSGRPHLSPEHPKVKLLALALLIMLSSGFGFLGGWLGTDRQSDKATTIQKQQIVLESQGELISQIAQTVGESVVSVNTKSQVNQSFFGFSQPTEQEGAGTGIILTEDGLMITNRHVVPAGTTNVSVTLSDGTEYENVEIVGRTGSNDSLDVAFLKVRDTEGKKLKPATLGDSSKMKVGESVVAIGNALGQFQNTVTSGIVSGYGRSVVASSGDGSSGDSLENLFQTDAAINEGNSGGPLVNLKGEVIGINTAIAAGDAQNIGFAIPINDVSGLVASVKDKGKLERPFLGVLYVPLTNDAAKLYGLSVNRGAYIAPAGIAGSDPIIDGGPADKAGVKEGDIITKIDDVAIDQNNSLSALVNKHVVGKKVKLTILRDGKEQTIDATLGAAPTD